MTLILRQIYQKTTDVAQNMSEENHEGWWRKNPKQPVYCRLNTVGGRRGLNHCFLLVAMSELAISEDALILVCLAIGSTIFTKLGLGTMELVNKKEVRGFVRVPLTSSLPMITPFHQDGCPRLPYDVK